MGNMDQFRSDSERTSSPGADEEEEEDGEEHEQIRLVHTPDPVFLTGINMDNHQSTGGINSIYNNLSIDLKNGDKDFTSIHCQNEYYSHYLRRKESKESSRTIQCCNFLKKKCTDANPSRLLTSLFPILSWLPNYNWKSDLVYDISAGFTVAVMNIPQGLAYALLAKVDPIVGLYMAFFPVITYALLGTSRHVSIGTFAVICLMSGKVTEEKAALYKLTQNETNSNSSAPIYTPGEITMSLSLCVGVWQLIMGVLQLGSLSVLLSSELISGFTTGCAIHVLTSQIKNLLGMSEESRRNGIFKIPLTYKDIALGIGEQGNVTAVILSIVTISVLFGYNELFKEKLSKKVPFPIPIELIAIIIGTLVSRYWITADAFGIDIVNHIPTGLPNPTLPPVKIVPDILVDSLIIAVVAYAISISMVKIFARKHDYEIRPNQELVANGASNCFGSFFGCAPIAVSLTRSLIQDQVGGRTQLASIFSCTIILFVLLWIGPFFETLPKCILASLVVVALKGMFMQFKELPMAWKESRLNGMIWLVSFLATVFLDIEYGLVLGLIMTVASLLWNSNRFSVIEVGQNPHSHLFIEKKGGKNKKKLETSDLAGIKILKLTGSLNFVTAETFASSMEEILKDYTNPNPALKKSLGILPQINDFYNSSSIAKSPLSTIILDLSSVSSVDPAGVKSISTLYNLESQQGVQVVFAACPSSVLHILDHCNFFNQVNAQHFYPSIEHAVQSLTLVNSHNDEPETLINENTADHLNGYHL